MEQYFVEGERSTKRVRLNKSDVFYYGTRNPIISPPKAPTLNTRRTVAVDTDETLYPSSSKTVMMNEILKQTKQTSNELNKLKNSSGKCCQYNKENSMDFMHLLFEELILLRQDLNKLKRKRAKIQFETSSSQDSSDSNSSSKIAAREEKLWKKAVAALEDIESKLKSVSGKSTSKSHRSSSSRYHQHFPEWNYSKSPAFSKYRDTNMISKSGSSSPLIPATSKSKAVSMNSLASAIEKLKKQIEKINISIGGSVESESREVPGSSNSLSKCTRRRIKRKLTNDIDGTPIINDSVSYHRALITARRQLWERNYLERPEPMDYMTSY